MPHSPWYRDWLVLPLVGVVYVLDQLTKYLVESKMYLGESIPTGGIFHITRTYNTGGAFGLFPDRTLSLILASFLGIAVLILVYRHHPFQGALLRISLGLQLGGAFGNLTDRLRFGHVTDFVQLGFWPVFNLADSCIVVGIGVLVWLFVFSPPRAEKVVPLPASDSPNAPGSGIEAGDMVAKPPQEQESGGDGPAV